MHIFMYSYVLKQCREFKVVTMARKGYLLEPITS